MNTRRLSHDGSAAAVFGDGTKREGALVRLLGVFRRDERRQSAAPAVPSAASPVLCPNKACRSAEFMILGQTFVGTADGTNVEAKAYGLRAVCLKCATVAAHNPRETYECIEGLSMPQVAAAPDGDGLPPMRMPLTLRRSR